MHYLPLVVYPHTNQPQPTATDHQPATATPYTHTITYPIILFHYIITIHDNSYYTRPTFAPIVLYTYIYNIIYLATILYPISYLKLHTRNYKQAPTNATPWYSIPLYLLSIYSYQDKHTASDQERQQLALTLTLSRSFTYTISNME